NPSNGETWRQLRALAGDVVEPPVTGYPFVRRVDRDKLSPIAATPTVTAALQSNDIRPPERRRGPSIDGEIARPGVDPKIGRVAVPKYERAADGVATPKRRRQSLLQEILGIILDEYYPQGVPENTSTSAVQQKVAAVWEAKCREHGRELTNPPCWDTIARRL